MYYNENAPALTHLPRPIMHSNFVIIHGHISLTAHGCNAQRRLVVLNPHTNVEKTRVFEYAGSARTLIAYGSHMKAIITDSAAIKVLRGPHGPRTFI